MRMTELPIYLEKWLKFSNNQEMMVRFGNLLRELVHVVWSLLMKFGFGEYQIGEKEMQRGFCFESVAAFVQKTKLFSMESADFLETNQEGVKDDGDVEFVILKIGMNAPV